MSSHPDSGVLRWRTAWPPSPDIFPEVYQGVVARRVLAYLLDALVIGLILLALRLLVATATLLTFGLLWPLKVFIIPLGVAICYHSLQIGGPASATLGMRVFDLRVHATVGGRPTLMQAFLQTLCFYATLGFTGGLLMLVPLFNQQRRGLHDFLAGTVVLRNVVG